MRPAIAKIIILVQFAIAAGLIVCAVQFVVAARSLLGTPGFSTKFAIQELYSDAETLAIAGLVMCIAAIGLRTGSHWSWWLALIVNATGFAWLGFTMALNRESNPVKGASVWLMALSVILLLVPDTRKYFADNRSGNLSAASGSQN